MHVVRMKQDDPEFKLKKGDLLEVIPYRLDPSDKFTVIRRLTDNYDPSCNVYRSQVEPAGERNIVSIKKTTTYTINPDQSGCVNEMVLTFTEGEKGIGSDYHIHHWHGSLNDLAGRLERMAAAIRAFKPTH